MANFISVKNESKVFINGDSHIHANDKVSFEVNKGELTVILGNSGAGKTTLLDILGGMDTLSSGSVVVDGNHLEKYSRKQLTTYRRHDIGFVFQFYNLIQNLTTIENVQLASDIANHPLDPQKTLDQVGLGKMSNHFPAQLSGGEQQRAAIVRAIAKNPALLLADEPTGALDTNTGKRILQLFTDFQAHSGKNVIIVTHNSELKKIANHVIVIRDGKVESDKRNQKPIAVKSLHW